MIRLLLGRTGEGRERVSSRSLPARRECRRTPNGSVLLVFTVVLVFGPFFRCHLGAQVVTGRVLDGQTSTPVVNGTVTMFDSLGVIRGRVLTDVDGRFRLEGPSPGTFTLRAGGLGYRSGFPAQITLALDSEASLELYLEPSPLSLEPLSVSSERIRSVLEERGFFERMEKGRGFFLTPSQLAARPPVTEAEVLTRAPFVEISRSWTGSNVLIRTSGRSCPPAIYVDDFGVSGGHLEDHVNFADIVAVEVFRGYSEIPQELAVGHETCGVIMIWTIWSELRSKGRPDASGGGGIRRVPSR